MASTSVGLQAVCHGISTSTGAELLPAVSHTPPSAILVCIICCQGCNMSACNRLGMSVKLHMFVAVAGAKPCRASGSIP